MNRRRGLAYLLASLLSLSRAIAADRFSPPGSSARRLALRNVKAWGCQLQFADVGAIGPSKLDLIVIDAMRNAQAGIARTRTEIGAMQKRPDGGRRLVLAYLSVGEAEIHRIYWRSEWLTSPPPWLGAPNANWPGAFAVRYWEPGWQQLVFDGAASLLANILAAGFDGVFLDRIDAYSDWETARGAAAADMIDLVERLAGRARALNPDCLLIAQNSEGLLADKRYLAAIDAVSKESLLFGRAGEGIENTGEQIAWSLKYLAPAQNAGLPIFAIEYLDDPAKKAAASVEFKKLGILPFFARRLLDRLPELP